MNIDAGLIKSRSADTVELTDGCICCDISSGLGEAFDHLRNREIAPDHVIIEMSGAAQPQRVEMWANSPGFRLDGVVILVDVEGLASQLDGSAGHLVKAQIEAADLLLLTKSDLVSAAVGAEARQILNRLAPEVPIVAAGVITSLAPLIAIGGRRTRGVADVAPQELFDIHTVRNVDVAQPITEDALHQIIDNLAPSVVRAKGVFATPDGRKLLVQVVGARRKITALTQAEDQQTTQLVVIEV